MKLDMQNSIPGTKGVLRGEIDGKALTAEVLPVSMAENPNEVAEVVHPGGSCKGNRDLNIDLEIKANELEKLFAEQKLRSASAPRRRPVRLSSAGAGVAKPAASAELVSCLSDSSISREGSIGSVESDARMLSKMVSNEDACKSSRGKHYEKYMQIRDAKLGEEWRSRGSMKEAQLKGMQEQLEHCGALMKSRLHASSSNRQDGGQQRAAELKQPTAYAIKQNKQQTLEVSRSGAGGDTDELETDRDRSVNGMVSDSSKSQHSKNNFPSSRNATSFLSQTLATSSPRSIAKPASSRQQRVSMYSEHLPSRSLPNVSDIRKGNGGRINKTRPATKTSYNQDRSTSAELNSVQDDSVGRNQSMEESSNSVWLDDVSSVNSNDSTVMPLLKEKSKGRSVHKSVKRKPFLRKGKGIGPGAGAVVVKLKASVALENLKSEKEPEGSHVETEGWCREINHGGDEFKMRSAEEASMGEDGSKMALDEEAYMDKDESKTGSTEEASMGSDENPGPSAGSDGNAYSEYCDVMELKPPRQFSSLSGIITSKESSSSTTNVQHTFTCAQHASDIDAFVDSLVGNSASGNLHRVDQIAESDTASMSMESVKAHKPVLAGSTSRQTKINVSRGFKRLLKFGKKCKQDDLLVNDRVSSSTNLRGDDMEDSCNSKIRILDDIKNSRIGLSKYHSATDDTNVGEISNVQGETFNCSITIPPDDLKLRGCHASGSHQKTPRSFFSLPAFRVKRGKSKLRMLC